MSGKPKDLNVSEATKETKILVGEAKPALDNVRATLDNLIDQFTRSDAGPEGQLLSVRARAIKAAIDGGVITAEESLVAIQRLLKQFALPLGIIGGMKLQGSGQLVDTGTKVWEGIQSSMTGVNKILHLVIGIVQILCATYAAAAAFFPQIGNWEIGIKGLTLAVLAGGVGRIVAVLNSNYPDVKKAELVALPKSEKP